MQDSDSCLRNPAFSVSGIEPGVGVCAPRKQASRVTSVALRNNSQNAGGDITLNPAVEILRDQQIHFSNLIGCRKIGLGSTRPSPIVLGDAFGRLFIPKITPLPKRRKTLPITHKLGSPRVSVSIFEQGSWVAQASRLLVVASSPQRTFNPVDRLKTVLKVHEGEDALVNRRDAQYCQFNK